MESVVVIPARYGSTRFPGKPLTVIAGITMIERVWRLGAKAVGPKNTYIATDDQRIIDAAQRFGALTVLTGECENGTARVLDAITRLGISPEVVINFQGDALLTPPWFIEALIVAFKSDPSCDYATPAVQISQAQYQEVLRSKVQNPFSGAFVTFDKNFDALYFSKQVIPALRSTSGDSIPVFKHIGMYAYRLPALQRYVELEPRQFELSEGLEQLRILENGLKIRVVPVEFKGRSAWSVDAPEDVAIVESIIAREGELL
jgi:3-deoxy-manno-octulosonate cytidylyltransferase (CMP-KDO synthetase)